ncbi:MAG: serine hydrolase [Pseudomonadota bacterium]|nr:serine hydrolase [Pseudomonadota bacterium]
MKLLLRLASTAIVAAGAVLTIHVATPVLYASVPAPRSVVAAAALGSIGDLHAPDLAADSAPIVAPIAAALPTGPYDSTPTWHRPTWFPAVTDVDAVGQMDGPAIGGKGPSLRSRSVFVYDLDAGQALIDKNADVVRPVASLTKMVSSLALMSTEPDLDTELCVTAAQYPTRSGARSRLSTGDCLGGWDVLGAALVASDNRAAYALAGISGLDMDDFVARMNAVSADLGMEHSSWSDPSGLEDDNLSTARDIARATVAVAAHPVLNTVSTAPFWDLHRSNKNAPRRLFTTDRLSGRTDLDVLAAKTGYTDTARYCFSTMVQTQDGRRLVITLLGADGKLSRWADVDRILNWVESGAS